MKTCTRCRQVKPLSEFHVMRARADGRKPACKACTKASLSDIGAQQRHAAGAELARVVAAWVRPPG